MGYFVTKIAVKKSRKSDDERRKDGKKRGFAIGGVSSRNLTMFTRQLSILQDAGLPILRSLRILEEQSKPGRLKNSLMDTCEEIEGGSTLSEAMSKSPKAFDRLYVNMIKAGEAGGALEVILQRLADFMEKAEDLKRKVKGAMVYPVIVIVGGGRYFVLHHDQDRTDFPSDLSSTLKSTLPAPTLMLIAVSDATARYWYLIPTIPVGIWLFVKLLQAIQARPDGLGLVHAERARVRHAGREELAGSRHANAGHAGAKSACRFWKA